MSEKSSTVSSTRSTMVVSGVSCPKTCLHGRRCTNTSDAGSAKGFGSRFMTNCGKRCEFQSENTPMLALGVSIVKPSRRRKKGGGVWFRRRQTDQRTQAVYSGRYVGIADLGGGSWNVLSAGSIRTVV